MSEAIPVGWQRRSLSSLGEYENGFAFNELHWSEHGLPIIRIAQITGTQGIVDRYPRLLPNTFRIDSGDLIFSWSGTLAVVRWAGGPSWLNQHLFKVVPAPGIERSLLFHVLQASVAAMNKRTHGSTMKHIKRGELREFFVSIPVAVDEQRKLASVLDNLDTTIQETEAIIAKLKAVKQGLLHDLLTRGIDANGELRPPQAEAPHLYKQSPLGWIPKAWEAHVFGRTVEHVIDFRGRTPKKLGMDWGGGDILALSANNVQPGAIDISREAYFGGERLYHKWMTNGDLWKGDVLLTMEAPLGNVAQIPDDARYILSQRVIALRFNTGVVLNDFAFWQMQSNEFQQAMVRRSTGSTATGIQRAELVKLHFKAPPLQEQSLIAERLASLEHKLESERLALAKQVQQKAGLVDDLLTGRVRVTPLLEGQAS
ncbi:restriction endonuclease subunit S [Tahibacter caeni]|uniref:restriction endonuclease subunit S n=1 Tax=Tahibacter caeni TaxID=1453545 RepID=UPI00214799B7|nr:restriction endonuclease subunit S [Tahibacter caeni]